MTVWASLKPVLLTCAIVLGLCAKGNRAEAATPETMVVAGGCFWCVEADFEKVGGVIEAVSGFTGGRVANPTYKQVTRGGTGHYEAVRITYDSDRIGYAALVALFLRSIDPTDSGGQFCDRGDSYRTAIFATPVQRAAAEAEIARARKDLGEDIVTPVLPVAPFYPADRYHQDYYKSQDLILTRFGPRSKSSAYKLYRDSCGRDTRVRQLWGSAAPFVGG